MLRTLRLNPRSSGTLQSFLDRCATVIQDPKTREVVLADEMTRGGRILMSSPHGSLQTEGWPDYEDEDGINHWSSFRLSGVPGPLVELEDESTLLLGARDLDDVGAGKTSAAVRLHFPPWVKVDDQRCR